MSKDYIKETLDYYKENATSFVDATLHSDMSELYDWFLSCVKESIDTTIMSRDVRILDLGCGTGRDAKHFLELGYSVEAVDGSASLCDFASSYIEQPVKCCLYSELDYSSEFDGVWACASLLHVAKSDIDDVINRVLRAIKPGGVFFTCFKYGYGEIVRDGRFFNNYDENSVVKLFNVENKATELNESLTGWEVLDVKITGDVRDGRADERWVNVVARKSAEYCNNRDSTKMRKG